MATTRQTYPLMPTSTLGSGSSTPTDDPNDTASDLFSSGSSPPLIVSFLAIGIFVVALTGVFGWKRLSRSRGLDLQPVTRPDRRGTSFLLGTRPVLWDVWTDPKAREGSPIEAMSWWDVKPLTAILTFLVPSVQPPIEQSPPIKTVDPGGRILFRMVRCLVSAVKRFYLADLPPSPPPHLSTEPDMDEVTPPAPQTTDEIEWGDASSLQVSVIIALPAQRRCGSGTLENDVDPVWKGLGEFCIGTMDVPWSDGG